MFIFGKNSLKKIIFSTPHLLVKFLTRYDAFLLPLQCKALTSPKRIGRYTVTSHCLGSGSFATVHLALDIAEHRQVACKMIRTRKEGEMSKVWKEVRILMALDHVSAVLVAFDVTHRMDPFKPNINKVYDVEENGRNMLVSKSSAWPMLTLPLP